MIGKTVRHYEIPAPPGANGRGEACRRREAKHLTWRLVSLLASCALCACFSVELELPDWTIPVTGETPIIEYASVPIEDRSERIELLEDLVIGERAGDPDYALYRPLDLAVDEAGAIYSTPHGSMIS